MFFLRSFSGIPPGFRLKIPAYFLMGDHENQGYGRDISFHIPVKTKNEMKEERKLSIKILDKDKVFIKKEL